MAGMTERQLFDFVEEWANEHKMKIAEDVAKEVGPLLTPENAEMIKLLLELNQKYLFKFATALMVSLIAENNRSFE